MKITPRDGVDCYFAAISIEKRIILLGSIYVHLGNTENIESATDVLAEAYTLCKNENKTGPIIFGDWNSRHPLWGDKLKNKHGKLLADYCADNSLSIISPHQQPTFVLLGKKRSSVIDFCITEQNCSDLVCNARVIEDIDFFSGAPEQGHWTVLFDIDIPVKNDPKRCMHNHKMANWEEISIQLEKIMVENMDSMITEAPTKTLLTFMDLVRGVCENSIPRKTLCKYSKLHWSNKLTHLSKKLKEAR